MTSQRSAIAAGAAIGAIAAMLANVQKARAAPVPAGVDPAVWEMMLNSVEITIVQQGQIETPASGTDPKGCSSPGICPFRYKAR